MKYIDSHVHFWDLHLNINTWVKNYNELSKNFMLGDFLADNPKPYGIVTVEAADGINTVKEVDWISKVILKNSKNIQIKHITYIDILQSPVDFIEALKVFLDYPFVCGFRHILAHSTNSKYSPTDTDATINNELMNNIYQNLSLLHSYNYIFNCQMYPDQLSRISKIIFDSKVKCVIDHCGLPELDRNDWLSMLDIYKNSNAFFKVSGFDINNNQINVKSILDIILDKISHKHLIFGSNYPLVRSNSLFEISNLIKSRNDDTLLKNLFFNNAYGLFKFD